MTTADGCNDTYEAEFALSQLASVCGLQRNVDPQGSPNTVRYRGDFTMTYKEYISLPGGASVLRTGSLVSPVDFVVSRSLTAETSKGITPYQPFKLQAAVTGTFVKLDATTSLVALMLEVGAPYSVWQITGKPTSQSAAADVPNLAQVWPRFSLLLCVVFAWRAAGARSVGRHFGADAVCSVFVFVVPAPQARG